jgi:hypothetical protein
MLEVMDHFRPNEAAEDTFAEIDIEGRDVLEEEPAGWVAESWLSGQRFALGLGLGQAQFVDVTDADVLAELNARPRVRAALLTHLAAESLGDNPRLDGGTIRLAGPLGRGITQAVSREIYEDAAHYAGIAYSTRFDDHEQCWALYDDRVIVQFDGEQPLDALNTDHIQALNSVAVTYRLVLPPNWLLDPNSGESA